MYIYRGLTTSQTHSLGLPNGLRIPFLTIRSIEVEPATDKASVTIRVTKHDGAARAVAAPERLAGRNAEQRRAQAARGLGQALAHLRRGRAQALGGQPEGH